MNIIFSTLIVILIILLFTIFAAWLDRFGRKGKEEFIDKAIEKVLGKVSTTVTSGIAMVMDQHKTGPWYLAVYTKDSNYPIWVSNNNIRSVHPDPKNRKIIIKQFCNEDMVIENVENYEMCSGNEMCDYDM
nr:MAG TPA: hypothetical protein [Caudoviricetes sp.]